MSWMSVPRCSERPMSTATKTATTKRVKNSDRLNCRLSPGVKRRAEEAAQVLGQTITAFTETALAEKAQAVLAQHEKIVLSERDFSRFVEIINNPEPPTPVLRRAMQEYEAMRAQNPDGNW